MINSKVIECLDSLQKAADTADEMRILMQNVLRWQPHLMALIGERAQIETNPTNMRFEKKYNPELKQDVYKLKSLSGGIDLEIIGDKQEFQRVACEILAACPLM